MPIPTHADPARATPNLLRDAVWTRIYEAIMDGTFELGERLRDEELCAWLQVSRTPVRNAINRLERQGILETAAGRYTRVVAPTMDDFVDTVEIGYEIWGMFAAKAIPRLSDPDQTAVVQILHERAQAFVARQAESASRLDAMNALLLERADSPTLYRLSDTSGPRLLLLVRRAFAAGPFPFAAAAAFSEDLIDAVTCRDGIRARQLITSQPKRWGSFFDDVAATGLFPAR